MSLLTETPARVLAVFAHPDDPEVACGGTLATWAAEGAEVRLVVVNAGDKGSFDASTDPGSLADRRAAEVARAAEKLGLAAVEHFGIPDGETSNSSGLRARLVAAIRAFRPDVVIAPDPTAVFFGDTYINHRDHRELGWATIDAVAPAAASPLYFPGCGSPHQVSTLLLSGSLAPDAWVDIGAHLDSKVAAVACHESRVGDDPELIVQLLRDRAAESGRDSGVDYAEGFRRLRLG